jgi:hypothetical protein
MKFLYFVLVKICGIPNHITQVLLLCTPAVVFLIKLYTEFLTVNLHYKERRQLKTFLTQIGIALPLTPDPLVIYF